MKIITREMNKKYINSITANRVTMSKNNREEQTELINRANAGDEKAALEIRGWVTPKHESGKLKVQRRLSEW